MPNHHPWVITFLQNDLLTSITAVPIPTMDKYSLLGLSLTGPNFCLQIVNFYHHAKGHEGNLTDLFNASFDHTAPILLRGDSNTHFDLWAPSGKWVSPWSETPESWLNMAGFLSTVPKNTVSWISPKSWPSLIDFIFINEAFLEVPSFPSSCSKSFDLSLGSDHTGLLLSLPFTTQPRTQAQPLGWIIDTTLKDWWCEEFWMYSLPNISDVDSLLQAGKDLLTQILEVSDRLFVRKKTPNDHNLPWWP
jgi:Endonuclease-reverse transcriptase